MAIFLLIRSESVTYREANKKREIEHRTVDNVEIAFVVVITTHKVERAASNWWWFRDSFIFWLFLPFPLVDRFKCWTVECPDRHHLADNGDLGSRQRGLQVHKIPTMHDNVCFNVRSRRAQHRSLRCYHTSHELLWLMETCKNPGDISLGHECPIFRTTVFPLRGNSHSRWATV